MVIITKCPGTVNSKTLSDFTKYSMNILCIFISIKKQFQSIAHMEFSGTAFPI